MWLEAWLADFRRASKSPKVGGHTGHTVNKLGQNRDSKVILLPRSIILTQQRSYGCERGMKRSSLTTYLMDRETFRRGQMQNRVDREQATLDVTNPPTTSRQLDSI